MKLYENDIRDVDMAPYKEAAKARRRHLYVYVSFDDVVQSTIHYDMVPYGVPYMLVAKAGRAMPMAAK